MTRLLDGKATAEAIRAEVATAARRRSRRPARPATGPRRRAGRRRPGVAGLRRREDEGLRRGGDRELEPPAARRRRRRRAARAPRPPERRRARRRHPRCSSLCPPTCRRAPCSSGSTRTKDVDGFHPVNVGRLWRDEAGFVPCTPAGIVELLQRQRGRARRPARRRRRPQHHRRQADGRRCSLRENCTVTVAHSQTRDLAAVCREADILVAADRPPRPVGAGHVVEGASSSTSA